LVKKVIPNLGRPNFGLAGGPNPSKAKPPGDLTRDWRRDYSLRQKKGIFLKKVFLKGFFGT